MRNRGCEPDIITFNSLMDICAKAAGYKSEGGPMDGGSGVPITTMTGYSVLQLISDEGLQPNVVTFATLMQLCAKCAARGRCAPLPFMPVHVFANVRCFRLVRIPVELNSAHPHRAGLLCRMACKFWIVRDPQVWNPTFECSTR